jgi:hypothetical protein
MHQQKLKAQSNLIKSLRNSEVVKNASLFLFTDMALSLLTPCPLSASQRGGLKNKTLFTACGREGGRAKQ